MNEVDKIAKNANVALLEAEEVLAALRADLRQDSELGYHVTRTLHEVEGTMRSLRILTDYLDRHPEALFQGKPDQ